MLDTTTAPPRASNDVRAIASRSSSLSWRSTSRPTASATAAEGVSRISAASSSLRLRGRSEISTSAVVGDTIVSLAVQRRYRLPEPELRDRDKMLLGPTIFVHARHRRRPVRQRADGLGAARGEHAAPAMAATSAAATASSRPPASP
jgi:hypothetical protein